MPDGVSHVCHTGLRKVARPAGLEPATPGLEDRFRSLPEPAVFGRDESSMNRRVVETR